MKTLYAVTRTPGPAWEQGKDRRTQRLWDEHAAFMDDLAERGTVILGGPIGTADDAFLIVDATNEAEIETILATDPWTPPGILATKSIERWTILLQHNP
jgi:uncharacterized protein YciI